MAGFLGFATVCLNRLRGRASMPQLVDELNLIQATVSIGSASEPHSHSGMVTPRSSAISLNRLRGRASFARSVAELANINWVSQSAPRASLIRTSCRRPAFGEINCVSIGSAGEPHSHLISLMPQQDMIAQSQSAPRASLVRTTTWSLI